MSGLGAWLGSAAARLLLAVVVLALALPPGATGAGDGELATLTGLDRARRLCDLGEARLGDNPAQAATRAEEAAEIARQEHDDTVEARALLLLGEARLGLSSPPAAVEALERAVTASDRSGDPSLRARCRRRLGDALARTGETDRAVEVYLDLLRRLEAGEVGGEEIQRRTHRANLLAAIGNVFSQAREVDTALDYYRRALAAYQELGNAAGVAGASYNIGNAFFDRGQLEPAMEHYQRAREAAATLDDKTLLTMAVNSIGAVHHRRGEYEAALSCFAESEALCRAIGHDRGVMFSLKKTGETQTALGQTRRAIASLEQALAIAEQASDRPQQSELHDLLATAFDKAGDPAAALVHLRRHDALEDELFTDTRSQRIRELEVAYEIEKKDRQIEALERERQLERLTRNALAGAVLLSLAVVLVLVSRYRLRARAAREVEQAHQELGQAYREVERLSRTDPLTGLPNRRAVWSRLEEERARLQRSKRPCAVAMADLDDFKRVNDRLGHDRGDAALVRVAETLRRALREQDLVGRWGGEEFLLVLPDTSAEGGRVVAEKLRQALAARPLLDDQPELSLTLTLGVAEMTTATSAEDGVRRADEALVAGKAAGKDRVVVWGGG